MIVENVVSEVSLNELIEIKIQQISDSLGVPFGGMVINPPIDEEIIQINFIISFNNNNVINPKILVWANKEEKKVYYSISTFD